MNPEDPKSILPSKIIKFPERYNAAQSISEIARQPQRKINVDDLLANGWNLFTIDDEYDNLECQMPYYKTIVEEYGEPILELVLTTINNTYEYELGLHHLRTGVLIYLRHPETYEEIAQFESMIIGVDEV